MNSDKSKPGWTVTGSHVVIPVELIEELQETLDDLHYARRAGRLLTEDQALEKIQRIINDQIGQPPTRAAG